MAKCNDPLTQAGYGQTLMDEEMICWKCVGDEYLVKMIRRTGVVATCECCDRQFRSIPLEALAEKVEQVLSEYVRPGDEYPVWGSEEDDYPSHNQQEGDPLNFWVREILGLDDDEDPVVNAVCGALTTVSHYDAMQGGEANYDEDMCYVRARRRPIWAEMNWAEFKSGIRHSRRFFNDKAKTFLDWLFDGIETLRSPGFTGTDIVRVIEPDSGVGLYRARRCEEPTVFNEIVEFPEEQLGAPPKEIAPSGRMNPAGVPVFYGAFERETCIAEMRPPVGGTVITGEFQVTRPLRVLDFKLLEEAYATRKLSMFHPEYSNWVGRELFLNSLHSKISAPVLPAAEHEYLTTQVICEYLSTQITPIFDGVIFASAQRPGGLNIVLFSHAVSAVSEDSPESFSGLGQTLEPTQLIDLDKWINPQISLHSGIKYVAESLLIHKITAAEYTTDDRRIRQGQIETYAEDYDSEWD